jgi:ABC-type branched-subunit amino acid transport system substrate-binding protein
MTTSLSGLLRVLLAGLVVGVATVGTVQAQVQPPRDSIPRNPDAELMFEQGLSAFERGAYDQAAERFRLVNDYRLNRKTTAALVMQGKALLRLGRYEEAVTVLTTLLDRYPQTSYRDEAKRVLDMARGRVEAGQTRVDTLHIGIMLPTADEYVGLTQAMFNGIRLAVDEHNGLRRRFVPPPGLRASTDSFSVVNTADVYGDSLAEAEGRTTVTTTTDTLRVDSLQVVTEQQGRPDWVAKMHFRAVSGSKKAAQAAADSLVSTDGVDLVLGPLFSHTARAAGGVAEQARVPLIAPLATDGSVSEGRTYVFQANPTVPLRGRIMARFAAQSLLTKGASIIYEKDNATSRQMAEGFQAEAKKHDLKVPFVLPLDNPRDWSRLPEAIEDDSTITDTMFADTEAFYLPIAGRNASGKIQDALTGMSRLNTEARILGNSYWHNLTVKQEASAFTATYANDFNVRTGRPEVQDFMRRYRLLTGTTPDDLSVRGQRLAYTGYDIATFVLSVLSPSPPSSGPDDLRTESAYEGLGIRLHFPNDQNVNGAMFFQRYRNNRIELLR